MKHLIFFITLIYSSSSLSGSSDESIEISMASEGALEHITQNASFLKFENQKFVRIKEGTNNFTCLVVRDPKGRFEPSCFNDQAMRSVFPAYELQMKMLYAGASPTKAMAKIKDSFNNGKLPKVEAGALVYMMSPNNLMFDEDSGKLVPTPIHHMYYYPKIDDKVFSLANGSPSVWQGYPHMTALIVVIRQK